QTRRQKAGEEKARGKEAGRQEVGRQEGRRQQDAGGQTTGKTGGRQENGRSRRRPGQCGYRSRRLRSAGCGPAAEGGQLRRPAVNQGQASLSPPASHRLGRREERDRLLRSRGTRREDGAR